MIESYLSINETQENLIIIEKSKFICYIKNIESEEDAKEFLFEVKKKNPFATHNCYAYVLDEMGIQTKCSDDGEPQGTAGYPILEVLKNSGLKKVIAVCTRYFGGVKLGTGGLARAYSGSVAECIKKCKVLKFEKSYFIDFNVKYEYYKLLQKLLNSENIKVLDTTYSENVCVKIAIPIVNFEKFKSKVELCFNGEKLFDIMKEDFFAYDIG